MSGPRTADAVVVGAGVVGAALAHALARAGLGRVVVCEQGRAGAEGATSRSGGLLRLHHTAAADTALAARGLPFFEHWADLVGGDCGYRRTGFVMLVGERHADALHRNHARAAEAAGEHRSRLVDPADLPALYPGLSTDGVGAAVWEPDGGYADPAATALALTAAARRLGVTVLEGVRVLRVVERGGAVTGVETTLGPVLAPLVVLAGGAWGAVPAAHLGVRVPVAPRRIGVAQAEVDRAGLRGSPASVPTCVDDTIGAYFRPEGLDRLFFGVPSAPEMSLDGAPAPLTADEVGAAVANLSRRVPALAGAPLAGTRAGFDGYTADKRPAIGPAGPDGLYLALAFSGGGFKTAPAVAELAAAEITEGGAVVGKAAQPLLDPYRPQRFDEHRPFLPEVPYDHM
ncbi:NAD(P)/FAD-dependent oxidoreductase [Streptomyces sp. NPDC060194]|uniref:NAD(P)/FAD-dependent oxidoreductase n=1 Tax=Streptomyces sp. NPDC060194 TaxID=3347069 RepID=UPI003651A3A3